MQRSHNLISHDFCILHTELLKYPTSRKGHNDVFSVVTGGRAPCFCDLSLGETATPACGRMRRGQGMPPQISHKKHQPGRLGTKEKTSFAQTNVE